MAAASGCATAHTPNDDDHAIVFEIGGAGEWSRAEGFHPGGTFAFEVTPVEDWLELEVGLTAIRSETSTEIPIDVLFKSRGDSLERSSSWSAPGRKSYGPESQPVY